MRASNSASVISLERASSRGATRNAPDNSNKVLAACARAAAGASLLQIACKVSRASSTGSLIPSKLVPSCRVGRAVEGRLARRAVTACPNPAWASGGPRRAVYGPSTLRRRDCGIRGARSSPGVRNARIVEPEARSPRPAWPRERRAQPGRAFGRRARGHGDSWRASTRVASRRL